MSPLFLSPYLSLISPLTSLISPPLCLSHISISLSLSPLSLISPLSLSPLIQLSFLQWNSHWLLVCALRSLQFESYTQITNKRLSATALANERKHLVFLTENYLSVERERERKRERKKWWRNRCHLIVFH